MRGRKAKPPEIHALNGNPSKLNLEKRKSETPQPDPIVPNCPAYLDGIARTEWRRVCPELAKLGLITLVDRAALAGYCAAYSEMVRAEKTVILEGQTYLFKRKILPRPEVKIAQVARMQVKAFCAEFGLTPSSRARMALPGKKETKDSLEELLGEANKTAHRILDG